MTTHNNTAPVHWPAAITLYGTSLAALVLLPTYAWFNDFSAAAWGSFVVLAVLCGLSITAGYHRLWAHRTYEAHWVVRFVLMVFGTMTVQNSILVWASGHRTHHRHVDDVDHDPYSAKRGFWFSHMGWMLRQYPSGRDDFSNAPDLLKDPMVMFQHKHYTALALGLNFTLPFILGYLLGDVWGVVLLGGLARLVWCHQTTFFINSLAHIWGRRPYTDENTARDNDLLAVFTYGEGYHNYHHLFQYDYRNGIKWYHIDPTKWLIAGLSVVGLTKNLKRCDKFAIEKARIAMQFKRAEAKLQTQPLTMQAQVEAFKARLAQEYEHYSKALQDWAKLKEAWYRETREALANGEVMAQYKAKFKNLEADMRLQRKRLQALVKRPALA
ncbi:acyl-CoA desaturase [Limnobacter sp.]|uniref:acyl-CoA desaturase n=1 Tax=Limnobacter sp. TaxID=2003368 RepID=UPI003517A014